MSSEFKLQANPTSFSVPSPPPNSPLFYFASVKTRQGTKDEHTPDVQWAEAAIHQLITELEIAASQPGIPEAFEDAASVQLIRPLHGQSVHVDVKELPAVVSPFLRSLMNHVTSSLKASGIRWSQAELRVVERFILSLERARSSEDESTSTHDHSMLTFVDKHCDSLDDVTEDGGITNKTDIPVAEVEIPGMEKPCVETSESFLSAIACDNSSLSFPPTSKDLELILDDLAIADNNESHGHSLLHCLVEKSSDIFPEKEGPSDSFISVEEHSFLDDYHSLPGTPKELATCSMSPETCPSLDSSSSSSKESVHPISNDSELPTLFPLESSVVSSCPVRQVPVHVLTSTAECDALSHFKILILSIILYIWMLAFAVGFLVISTRQLGYKGMQSLGKAIGKGSSV